MPLLTIKTSFQEIFFFNVFIYSFIFGCAGPLLYQLFSSVARRGYPLVAVHELLTVVASLAVEHGL